jgi:hypothetical protein
MVTMFAASAYIIIDMWSLGCGTPSWRDAGADSPLAADPVSHFGLLAKP